MIIGGIALIARGVRRMTTDIDAAVRGDAITPERLLDVLAEHGIAPRISGAVAFARKNLVLLLRHEGGVDLDVSFGWSAFEHDALDAATTATFGRVDAKMATPADLIVLKVVAGRAKDLEDTEALLLLYPKLPKAALRARVAELAELAEVPELVSSFDAIVKRLPRPQTKKARARR